MARTKQRITQKAFLRAYHTEQSKHQKAIHKLVTEYLVGRSPVKDDKVYMLVSDSTPRKRKVRAKRVLIMRQGVTSFGGTPIVRVSGWILDKEGHNVKWGNWLVHGLANPSVFELAEDQSYILQENRSRR